MAADLHIGSSAVTDEAPDRLDTEIAGLDALEGHVGPRRSLAARIVAAAWPKLAAVAVALLAWQAVVWSGWRPEFVLPAPATVFDTLGTEIAEGRAQTAVRITMGRAARGFLLALAVGGLVGILVSRFRVLRSAIGSLITGLQTMPSIAWFPIAILLFQLDEGAILFVVVLGAAPAIANGLIAGIDQIPPILLRAGRVLGARGIDRYRFIVLPAALPGFMGGLKQGWAFAWRSLMAGELLVVIRGQFSIGFLLEQGRELFEPEIVLSYIIVILAVGILVDVVLFGTAERAIRRRWGLLEES